MRLISEETEHQTNMLTLMLLINFRLNHALDEKSRAIKISKSCKKIRDISKDSELVDTCRQLIKEVQSGRYNVVNRIVAKTEIEFCKEHKI